MASASTVETDETDICHIEVTYLSLLKIWIDWELDMKLHDLFILLVNRYFPDTTVKPDIELHVHDVTDDVEFGYSIQLVPDETPRTCWGAESGRTYQVSFHLDDDEEEDKKKDIPTVRTTVGYKLIGGWNKLVMGTKDDPVRSQAKHSAAMSNYLKDEEREHMTDFNDDVVGHV